MAIPVRCDHCEARLQVKEAFAGRKAKCPKCGQTLIIPQLNAVPTEAVRSNSQTTIAAEKETIESVCPSCQAPMPRGGILCLQCGFHLIQQKRLGKPSSQKNAELSESEALELLKSKTCSACGGRLNSSNRCLECGGESAEDRSDRDRSRILAKRRQRMGAESPVLNEGSYEHHRLQNQEAAKTYLVFRDGIVERLLKLWRQVAETPASDEGSLKRVLRTWPDELVRCIPPKDMFTVPGLHPANLHCLRHLEHGAQRLADVTTADLVAEVTNHPADLHRRATQRIAMLTQLAKSLGKHPRGPNLLAVHLETSSIASDAFLMGEELVVEQLTEVLKEQGVAFTGLDNSFVEALGSGRSLEIALLEWDEAVTMAGDIRLKSLTRVSYEDLEPNPDSEGPFQKVYMFEKLYAKESIGAPVPYSAVKQAWATFVLAELPSEVVNPVKAKGAIDIACPNCGHPDMLTEAVVPKSQKCLKCGNDSITGQSLEVVKVIEAFEAKRTVAVSCVVGGLLPIIGSWVFFAVTGRMAFWPFLSLHLLGITALAFGAHSAFLANSIHRDAEAGRAVGSFKLKHPEAVTINRQRIEAKDPIS